MKKFFLLLATLAATFLLCNKANAIPIFYNHGNQAVVTHTLPDSVAIDGHHIDVGIAFQEFSIMWIPMWTWGPVEYAVISKKTDTYWELDAEEIAMIKEDYGIDLADKPVIPFWHRIGGKLIWAVLLGLMIWGYFSKKDDEEKPEEHTDSQPAEE